MLKNLKANAAILGVLIIAVTVAVGSVVGMAVVGLAGNVFWNMELSADANSAMQSTETTILQSWPLSSLAVLAAFGAMAIGVFITYLGMGRR